MQKNKEKGHKTRNLSLLTEGPVGWSLIRMSASMLIGFIAGAAFNVTDTYFVSRLGTNELAAMGYTFPVTMVVFGISMGIGIGVSSVLSRTIGQGDLHKVQRLTVDSLLLALILVGIFITVGLLTIKPLFRALGADEATLPLVMDYMRIWYVSIGFLTIPIVGNNAIRATGDTLSPSVIMVLDLGLNIILDPVLIFGWGPFSPMGIKGAAIATVFSRMLALIASVVILGYRKRMLTRELPTFSQLWNSWKGVLYIGIPASLTHILMPLGAAIIIRMVSGFGTAAVAAYSAGSKVEQVSVIPIIAVASSLIPFVGQNWGAGKYLRVLRAQRFANTFIIVWGLCCIAAICGAAKFIAPVFTEDPSVKKYLITFLTIVPFAFGFRGLAQNASCAMNAINHPYHSTAMITIRLFVLTIPLAALGMWRFGYVGLLGGIVAAEVLNGLISTRWIQYLYKRHLGQVDAGRIPAGIEFGQSVTVDDSQ